MTGDAPPAPQAAAEIIDRYNDNALKLRRVSAFAAAFVRFRDPDTGDMRREQGDGRLTFVRPDRVALTTGKLGNTLLWAGNNDRQFWLFDLQNDTAYAGSYARLGQPGAQPLPLPVRPDRLPSLLGLMPIDPADAHSEWHDGDLLVETRWGARRLLLDPRTGLARRVDLLDERGRSEVISELSGEKTLTQGDGSTVRLPAEAAIRVVGEAGDLTLKLANLTDDESKFNEGQFDFDVLVRQHKPKKIVNLDGEARE